jgi:hypothetical protein
MFRRIASAGAPAWLRTFTMGVAVGLTAQALSGGWHWLRAPGAAAAAGTAGTPEPPAPATRPRKPVANGTPTA